MVPNSRGAGPATLQFRPGRVERSLNIGNAGLSLRQSCVPRCSGRIGKSNLLTALIYECTVFRDNWVRHFAMRKDRHRYRGCGGCPGDLFADRHLPLSRTAANPDRADPAGRSACERGAMTKQRRRSSWRWIRPKPSGQRYLAQRLIFVWSRAQPASEQLHAAGIIKNQQLLRSYFNRHHQPRIQVGPPGDGGGYSDCSRIAVRTASQIHPHHTWGQGIHGYRAFRHSPGVLPTSKASRLGGLG